MDMIETTAFRLTTGSFDQYDRIRPYAVFDLFQEVAGMHAYHLGIGFDTMMARGIIWVLARNKYVVEHPIILSSQVMIKTWPHPHGRFECDRDYEIYDEAGRLCIRGTSKWCLVSLANMRILPMSNAAITGEFYPHQTFDQPMGKIEYNEQDSFILAGHHQVCESDLDHNGHMNNARYADCLLNVLSLHENEEIIMVETEYRQQLFKNQIIDLRLAKHDLEAVLIGECEGKVCFITRCQWRKHERSLDL